MTDPPEFFDHGGEKIKKTIPIPVIFKDPAPKVARQDLTPSSFAPLVKCVARTLVVCPLKMESVSLA
jgi:hypothetical protein